MRIYSRFLAREATLICHPLQPYAGILPTRMRSVSFDDKEGRSAELQSQWVKRLTTGTRGLEDGNV